MVKLSKLTSGFSLSDINFSGFSQSENWVGYFEKKGAFSYDLIDKAINLFEGFFGASGDEGIILVALSFNDEREDDVDTIKKYGKLYEDVKDKGLVFPMNDDFESYLYGDSCLPASSLKLSFDANDFKDLSRLLMCHAGVIGQVCFYINLSKNVAIYPHDDVGFGCIALNSDTNTSKSFLSYCSKDMDFEVFLNEDDVVQKI